jgi:hypothetical protein
MVAAAWVLGRRQLGAGGGALLAVALALGSQGELAARLMSGEALAAPALAVALLVLLELARREECGMRNAECGENGLTGSADAPVRFAQPQEAGSRIEDDSIEEHTSVMPWHFGSATALWALYAAAGVLALLTHRLATPFMAGCFGLWLILLLSPFLKSAFRNPHSAFRIPHSAFFWVGLAAHVLILLAAAAAPVALLPADERALAGLPAAWFGFGGAWGKVCLFALGHGAGLIPHALLAPRGAAWLTCLALAAFLLPTGVVVYRTGFFRNPPLDAAGCGARRLALGGLFVALFAFGLTLLLQRTRWGALFAWPVGVLPGWAAGGAAIAGLGLWGARRAGRRWLAWVALVPWLIGGLAGQAIELRHEVRLGAALRQELARAAAPAAPLYVIPAELIPYVNRLFAGRDLRPLEALATPGAAAPNATLVQLNPWPLLDFGRDTVTAALAGAGKLSRDVRRQAIPSPLGMELITLAGLDRAALATLAARRFGPREPDLVPGALMRVLPQDLHPGDGWGALEAGPQGEVWRWSMAGTVRIRLPQPLPEGACTVILKGMRLPHPPPAAAFSLRPAGGARAVEFSVPQNWFEVRVPLAPGRGGSRRVLELTHPTFHMADFQPGATDPRRLGFLFLELRVSVP